MPGQPFLDWLHRVDPTSGELSLEDLRREPTIYLLPECENEEEAREYLEEVCGEIFQKQLNGWYRVPSSWPSRQAPLLHNNLLRRLRVPPRLSLRVVEVAGFALPIQANYDR